MIDVVLPWVTSFVVVLEYSGCFIVVVTMGTAVICIEVEGVWYVSE
jgi:hypothetical protein